MNSTPPSATTSTLAKGLINLTNTPKIPAQLLNDRRVRGFVAGSHWKDFSSAEGVYDWTPFDDYIAQIPEGKWIRLAIGQAASEAPQWALDAVPDNEKVSYRDTNEYHDTYNEIVTIPVAWSETWCNIKAAMIKAVGARYAGNALIKVVEWCWVTGSHNDWSIPAGTKVDGVPPEGSTMTSRMLDAGYSHEAIVRAGKLMLDTNAAAFPKQILVTPSGPIDKSLEDDPLSVIKEVLDYGQSNYGASRIVVANYGINGHMPDPVKPTSDLALYDLYKPNTAGQALWNCSGDDSYRVMGGEPTDKSVAFTTMIDGYIRIGGVGYFEAYQKDLMDTQMSDAIDDADAKLMSTL
jgi:Beta-galactosidase